MVALTARRARPAKATRWTGAMMAELVGISVCSVQRIWCAHGPQPHRYQLFKLSNDLQFMAKLSDFVGLCVDLAAHTIVPSLDERSQIRVLHHTQRGMSMKPGRLSAITHYPRRNTTTTRFDTLDV